jgi:transposase
MGPHIITIMFIRATTTKNRKTGAEYTTHRLVETHQTEKGPRQRMVMSIGKLDLPKSRWKELAKALEYRLSGSENFAPDDIKSVADEVMKNQIDLVDNREEKEKREKGALYENIDLNSIGSSDSRSIGPELACCSTWKQLGLDEILDGLGFSQREKSLAKIVIMGRLIKPGSDHSTWEWYRGQSSLRELLPKDQEEVGRNSIYEIADLLMEHKEGIEKALYSNMIGVHNTAPSIFLFDLTNLYFEGLCEKNELAMFGKSKEKRSDCRLVTLALMVDQNGFPVGSKIYKGNQAEPPTFTKMLDEYMPEDGMDVFAITPTIIMDRGIATKENVQLLRDRKLNYAVVERHQDLKSHIEDFKGDRSEFDEVVRKAGESVWVKKVLSPLEGCSKIICVSETRAAKEEAMVTKKEERLVADLERLRCSIEKGSIKKTEVVLERIGRLKERYGKVVSFYEINHRYSKNGQVITEMTFARRHHKAEDVYGCYSIETSHQNLGAEEIWRLYMTLTRVESSFRSIKTDLGTRPIYHQLAHRTSGHLFTSVLAYHLLISMEYRLRQKGSDISWKTARDILSTHQRQTVMMTNDKSEMIHVRVTGTPESSHREVYQALEVNVEQQRLISRVGFRL